MKKLRRTLALFIVTVMLLSAASVSAQTQAPEAKNESYGVMKVLIDYIDRYYHYGADKDAMLSAVLERYLEENPEAFTDIAKTLVELLDEHSVYYTPEEFNAFTTTIEAEFAGVGAYLTKYDGKVTITSVMENSPAAKAGILANDAILAVNGEDVVGADMDYVLSLVRGKSGDSVVLKIGREGREPFDVTIVRALLHDVTVSGSIINDNIGYVAVNSFSTNTGKEFRDELARLKGLGADRYIVDLRNNGGGVTEAATECAAQFLPVGAPIYVEDSKSYGKAKITVAQSGGYENLAVLVNEYTASASEIFSTAIQTNDAGIIIGTKTYGKGTVQTTLGLGSYGGLKLTIAEFLTPGEEPIDKTGIIPDVYVSNVVRMVEDDDLYPLYFNKKFKQGDTDEQIFALKHRLAILDYYQGDIDNYFDAGLKDAVKRFQAENGLFSYGELDFTTQTAINNLVKTADIMVDTQLDTAIEMLSE